MSLRPSPTPTTAFIRQLRSFQTRFPTSTVPPEDSISLRVFVQLLVSVGIVAVSVAAAGVLQASALNLLAVPVSALGGYWSWQYRNRPNVTAKFIIAFGMLMALGIFLTRLVGESGDTRMRLAELLIHLQVLHSFDMPRRKDLGYSVVIGLILLGVAATISQTLTLAPVLLLFLAIALPVLGLDYRSRLGLKGDRVRASGGPLSLKQSAWLLVGIVALGLAIFAALPRLPGYQVRNFPVSDTINFQGEFGGDQIYNSGYLSEAGPAGEGGEGEAQGGILQGGIPEEGPGEIDGSSYYGFNQRINQNLRGVITPQVMMRVRSQAPGFWRMLAFDRYTGQGWEISKGDEEDVEILERSLFSYKTRLPTGAFKLGQENTAGRYREVVQTYTIVNDLPNLIPVLYQAKELYFPTKQVAIDAEGSLRAPLPLANGLTFTAISEVPYRDRTQLRTASTDYGAAVLATYLQIPQNIRERVQQQTEELLSQAPQPITDPYETTLFLAQVLKQNYSLRADLPFFESEEDLVEAFLFRYEGGYADHFSTVLTVMLRSIGIPARLVTGFAPGQFNPFTGYYIVKNTDAYALAEVYFPGYGWFAFDPIPGHEVIPPSIRDSQTFSVLRQFWNWVAGWLPSPVSGWLSGAFSAIVYVLSRLLSFFRQGVLGLVAGLLCVTALGFMGWLAWLNWRRWRRYSRLQQLPVIEQAYQRMLSWLAQQGHPKRPSQTPLEYGRALQHKPEFRQAGQVLSIIQVYLRWRYGNLPEDADWVNHQVTSLINQSSKINRSSS